MLIHLWQRTCATGRGWHRSPSGGDIKPLGKGWLFHVPSHVSDVGAQQRPVLVQLLQSFNIMSTPPRCSEIHSFCAGYTWRVREGNVPLLHSSVKNWLLTNSMAKPYCSALAACWLACSWRADWELFLLHVTVCVVHGHPVFSKAKSVNSILQLRISAHFATSYFLDTIHFLLSPWFEKRSWGAERGYLSAAGQDVSRRARNGTCFLSLPNLK